jgi:hypothetical protein
MVRGSIRPPGAVLPQCAVRPWRATVPAGADCAAHRGVQHTQSPPARFTVTATCSSPALRASAFAIWNNGAAAWRATAPGGKLTYLLRHGEHVRLWRRRTTGICSHCQRGFPGTAFRPRPGCCGARPARHGAGGRSVSPEPGAEQGQSRVRLSRPPRAAPSSSRGPGNAAGRQTRRHSRTGAYKDTVCARRRSRASRRRAIYHSCPRMASVPGVKQYLALSCAALGAAAILLPPWR